MASHGQGWPVFHLRPKHQLPAVPVCSELLDSHTLRLCGVLQCVTLHSSTMAIRCATALAMLLCMMLGPDAAAGGADRALLKSVDPPCIKDADCAASKFCTSGKLNPAVSICADKVRLVLQNRREGQFGRVC